jgi:hypothetical protein
MKIMVALLGQKGTLRIMYRIHYINSQGGQIACYEYITTKASGSLSKETSGKMKEVSERRNVGRYTKVFRLK